MNDPFADLDPTDRLPNREPPAGSCASCAFRHGTLANQDLWNRAKIAACLMEGAEFQCHEDTKRTCRGFTLASAFAPTPQRWKEDLAEHICTMMSMAEENPESGDRLLAESIKFIQEAGL